MARRSRAAPVPLASFRVEESRDERLIAHINRLAPHEVRQRRRAGHLPYLAYVQQAPVGHGWIV